jgi:glycosyltransferase involved in cell wall biosynthesis
VKIGVEVKAFKNGTTGIARYLRMLLSRLQKMDTENEYLLFTCAPVEYAVTNPKWKMTVSPTRMPGVVWQQLMLPGILQRENIDLLWSPEQICPVRFKGPIITTVHDLTALRFPETCQRSNRYIQKYLFPPTVKRSSCLIPVSDYIGSELLASYPAEMRDKKMVTVTNASPDWEPQASQASSAEEPFLFFAGNQEPRKNLIRLIDALEILRGKGTEIALHIAGPSGWRNQALRNKIAASAVKEQVRFLGYLPEDELKQQYRTCTAVVYPSLYEGFGLPLLEAFCMGARVITSKHTVMEEIAGDKAVYFDPFDSGDMARVIATAIDAPFNPHTFSTNVRPILSEYSWENSARRLLDLFAMYG